VNAVPSDPNPEDISMDMHGNLSYPKVSKRPDCCLEYRCRRKKPILIRLGPLSGRWYAITDWKETVPKWSTTGRPMIECMQKHDVTDELTAALIDAGWTPPPIPDLGDDEGE